MSLEKAKEVSVSMRSERMAAPARNVDDIQAVLDQPGDFDESVSAKFRKTLDTPPPTGLPPDKLALYHRDQGRAALQLGQGKRALDELRTAYGLAESAKAMDPEILIQLGTVEARVGRFKRSAELYERARAMAGENSRYQRKYGISICRHLVKLYARMGDFQAAEDMLEQGRRLFMFQQADESRGAMGSKRDKKHQARKKAPARPHEETGEKDRRMIGGLKRQADFHDMEATLLEVRGKFKQAEEPRRQALAAMEELQSKSPHGLINARRKLAVNLRRQKRPVAAELEARKALGQAVAHAGKGSSISLGCLEVLAKTVADQGRFPEAEKLARAQVAILEEKGVPDDAIPQIKARMLLADILSTAGDYEAGAREFELALSGAREDPFSFDPSRLSPDILLALILTGRENQAGRYLDPSLPGLAERFGEDSTPYARRLALRGLVSYRSGDLASARKDLDQALPALLKDDADFSRSTDEILEQYMALLADIRGTPLEGELGIDAASLAFSTAEAAGGHGVEQALAANSARTASLDPELAELVRAEQDAGHRLAALETVLVDALAMPPDQQDKQAINDAKAKTRELARAKQALLAEIKKGFPDYFDMIRPGPADGESVRKVLGPGEVFVSVYTTDNATYVWAVPANGETAFAVSPVGRAALGALVDRVRKAVDISEAETFADVPEFDLDAAWRIYRAVLKPVAPALAGADELVAAVRGPLARIPLALLATRPPALPADDEALFDRYKKVPWLVRDLAPARVPSAASLIALRSLPAPSGAEPFLGFGDPFFSKAQYDEARSEEGFGIAFTSRGLRKPSIRSVGAVNASTRGENLAEGVELLDRLPDTAEEVRLIARSLGADETRDVRLGVRADEAVVKSTDMRGKRVVAFATHALVPGDLASLDEPALALSSPTVTGSQEDGLLTMAEIMGLRLNADWVVLSACNTGAGDGAGAEAVSGLGRAFFYAGSRALLVSMWPVESGSAMELTTTMFRDQKAGRLTRAGALRRSMLSMIDRKSLDDPDTGRPLVSYAHPLFWAPFVIVGEPGGGKSPL